MAQARIYWNRENFQMVEKIFRKSVEFCNEDDTWKLNVAHVLFMQNKYKEAIGFYEPIVKKHYDNVSVSGLLVMFRKKINVLRVNMIHLLAPLTAWAQD